MKHLIALKNYLDGHPQYYALTLHLDASQPNGFSTNLYRNEDEYTDELVFEYHDWHLNEVLKDLDQNAFTSGMLTRITRGTNDNLDYRITQTVIQEQHT